MGVNLQQYGLLYTGLQLDVTLEQLPTVESCNRYDRIIKTKVKLCP